MPAPAEEGYDSRTPYHHAVAGSLGSASQSNSACCKLTMSSPIVGWACSLPDDDRREDIAKVEQQQVGHSTKSTLSRSCGTHVFRPRQSASDRTERRCYLGVDVG